MKTRSITKFVMVVLCAAALGPFAGVLQAFALGEGDGPLVPDVVNVGPPLVRLIGTFCNPAEQNGKEGLPFLRLQLRDKTLVFKLDKMQSLSGDRTGDEILQNLMNNQLFLRGADKPIHRLEGPKIVGKRFYIEGNLLLSDRVLDVTSTGEQTAKAG